MSYIERKQVQANDPEVVAYMLMHRGVTVSTGKAEIKTAKEVADAIRNKQLLYLHHAATGSRGMLSTNKAGELEFSYDTDYPVHTSKGMTLYEMFVSGATHATEAYLQAAVMLHQDQLGNQYEVMNDVLGTDNVWHAGEMKIFQSDSQSQMLGATSI
jgi:hypothetical protein